MAILFSDEQLACAHCGNKLFSEVSTYLYTKSKDRIGDFLIRERMSAQLVCSNCGKIYEQIPDILKIRIRDR